MLTRVTHLAAHKGSHDRGLSAVQAIETHRLERRHLEITILYLLYASSYMDSFELFTDGNQNILVML